MRENLRIAEPVPISLRIALGKKHAFGSSFGPMIECITERAIVFAERLRSADTNDAPGTVLEDDVGLA